ncbi:hypothetical protein EOA25_28780 [Mesorhizobium sp. M2A.F.Ca.ET.040.01.1.1]|nr:hypothetical protein EOA25_28780 [Mesorhizobium sp. M2A.F.Ca.ET.040.01.1.1]
MPDKRHNVVELTPAREADLKAVNVSVNRRIKERSDIPTSGKADYWELPATQGDCEDFAILKKKRTAEARLASFRSASDRRTIWRRGHTVLTVRTSKGDKNLDNRTGVIRDWSNTPYRYFARSPNLPARNGSVSDRRDPTEEPCRMC